MPTGTTVSFLPQTIPAPGSGNSTMTISVVKFGQTGTFPITVTGSGGGIQQHVTVTLTVVAPPNFNLLASPGTLTVVQGNQGTSTITSTISGGFNSSIALSRFRHALRHHRDLQSADHPGARLGQLHHDLYGRQQLPTGTYLLTVTGNGGGLLRYALVKLTVAPMPNFAISASPLVAERGPGQPGDFDGHHPGLLRL